MDYQIPASAIHTSIDQSKTRGFKKEANLAQYGGSDYSNAVRVERGISLDEAFTIAKNDPAIDYFVYLKGGCMVLPLPTDVSYDFSKDSLGLVSRNTYVRDSDGKTGSGLCRIFYHGDTVFFKKEGKWLGTAPDLADTYSKE